MMNKCGDCIHFERDGKCNYFFSEKGKSQNRKFDEAPFWVWSDCYSDKEQVFENKETKCIVFEKMIQHERLD